MAGSGWVPVGQHDEDAGGQPFDEVAEQDGARRVDPVDVVEDQEHGAADASSCRSTVATPVATIASLVSGPASAGSRDPVDGIPSNAVTTDGNAAASSSSSRCTWPEPGECAGHPGRTRSAWPRSGRPGGDARPRPPARPARPRGASCRSPRGRRPAARRGHRRRRPATRHPTAREPWNGRRRESGSTSRRRRPADVADLWGLVPGRSRRGGCEAPPSSSGPVATPCPVQLLQLGSRIEAAASASRSRAPEYTSRASACRPDR